MSIVAGIGARLVERWAARTIREAKIKRKSYAEGHTAGQKIGASEVLALWRSGMTYEQARKKLRQ